RLGRGAGARARGGEFEAGGKVEARWEENREASAAGQKFRELGQADVRAFNRGAARTAAITICGLARDVAERIEPRRRWLPRDAAIDRALARIAEAEAGAHQARLAIIPFAGGAGDY